MTFPVNRSFWEKWQILNQIGLNTFKAWAILTRMLSTRVCQIRTSIVSITLRWTALKHKAFLITWEISTLRKWVSNSKLVGPPILDRMPIPCREVQIRSSLPPSILFLLENSRRCIKPKWITKICNLNRRFNSKINKSIKTNRMSKCLFQDNRTASWAKTSFTLPRASVQLLSREPSCPAVKKFPTEDSISTSRKDLTAILRVDSSPGKIRIRTCYKVTRWSNPGMILLISNQLVAKAPLSTLPWAVETIVTHSLQIPSSRINLRWPKINIWNKSSWERANSRCKTFPRMGSSWVKLDR